MNNKSFPDIRLATSVLAGRIAGQASRTFGQGGGTAAPGKVAERLDPALLTKLAHQLPQGSVLVTGTNGKTTASSMIAAIADEHGWKVVHNTAGANMKQGVLTSLLENSSATGTVYGDIGVLECDELTLLDVAPAIQPRMIVFNNVYRDQEDRYGGPDALIARWHELLSGMSPHTTLVVNGDDPRLVALARNVGLPTVYFSVVGEGNRQPGEVPEGDRIACPQCGTEVQYHARYIGALGDWYCPNCDTRRPDPNIYATDIHMEGTESASVLMHDGNDSQPMTIGAHGFINACNALAAVAATRTLGIDWPATSRALANFDSPFGRNEHFEHEGRQFVMMLAKNTDGFNEVLAMVQPDPTDDASPVMIAVNNEDADGTDVSWLAEVDFARLTQGTAPIVVAGQCHREIEEQVLNAGVVQGRITNAGVDTVAAFDTFATLVPAGATAFIVPNYTVMKAMGDGLSRRGILARSLTI